MSISDQSMSEFVLAQLNEAVKEEMDLCFEKQVEQAKADLEKEMRGVYAKTTVKMFKWFECQTMQDRLVISVRMEDLA